VFAQRDRINVYSRCKERLQPSLFCDHDQTVKFPYNSRLHLLDLLPRSQQPPDALLTLVSGKPGPHANIRTRRPFTRHIHHACAMSRHPMMRI